MGTGEVQSASDDISPFSFDNALWKHYTVFDGLVGMQVEDIYQDRRGFIWVATADGGLSRFDGVHFDNLSYENDLPNLTVMAITESEDGQLWFGTLGGGVAVYDRGEFQVYTTEHGLPSNEVVGLRSEPDGSILVLTGGGVGRFCDGQCVETVTEIDGQPIGYVYDIVTDITGSVWLATLKRGIISLDNRRLCIQSPEGNEIFGAWKFAEDHSGRIWIAAMYTGTDSCVYRYIPQEQRLEIVETSAAVDSKAVQSGVRHIRIDGRGRVWIAHRGVLVFDGTVWKRFSITLQDINFSDTRLTYEDREGNIWVGLWGGGLIFCDPVSLSRFTDEDGLPDGEVTNLAEDRENRMWIGTMGGMARMEKGRVTPVSVDSDRLDPTILSLTIDQSGQIWAGSERGKIYKWGGDETEVIQIADIGDEMISSLCEDQRGRMWIGTHQGTFGWIEDDRFIAVTEDLPDDFNVMIQDRYEQFWIGCHGYSTALYFYDGSQFHVPAGKDIEQIRYVNALCEAPDGTLWIGTGIGLFAYDYDEREVRHFTVEHGLSENAVSALAVDRQGHLWIGTSGGGVVRYDGRVFQVIRLGDSALENKVEAILCEIEGQVWFGTRAGLVAYHPGETPPSIAIRQVASGHTYWEPEIVTSSEDIPEIRIVYQGISFRTGARQLRYSYRLTGPDQAGEWSAFTSSTQVVYRDLIPGEYRFEARAMDRDRRLSEPAVLRLNITSDLRSERIQALEGVLRTSDQPLIGESAAIQKTLEQVSLVANTDMTVLILGETGTGKGLIARTIHELSQRRERPFIQLNCGAIPEGLIESELFGHEKGAFTGAVTRKIGHFELANEGTLFLDEIGDLPLESQRVLLHILEENTLTRIGGGKPIPVNVRVIAATNRDLRAAIRERTFREDLFFRLKVFTLDLPPLRERREDIPSLVRYFAEEFARHLNRLAPTISSRVIRHLQEYSWPGNVRELEHLLQRAVLMCKDNTIQLEDLPVLAEIIEASGGDVEDDERESRSLKSLYTSWEEREKQLIEEALEATDWTISGERGAAKLLDIHPQKLRSRMRKYGIERPRKNSRK